MWHLANARNGKVNYRVQTPPTIDWSEATAISYCWLFFYTFSSSYGYIGRICVPNLLVRVVVWDDVTEWWAHGCPLVYHSGNETTCPLVFAQIRASKSLCSAYSYSRRRATARERGGGETSTTPAIASRSVGRSPSQTSPPPRADDSAPRSNQDAATMSVCSVNYWYVSAARCSALAPLCPFVSCSGPTHSAREQSFPLWNLAGYCRPHCHVLEIQRHGCSLLARQFFVSLLRFRTLSA